MNHMNQTSHCNCSHHKVLPAFLILVGLSFLMTHFGVISTDTNSIIWPVLVILLGIAKLKGGSCSCYKQQS